MSSNHDLNEDSSGGSGIDSSRMLVTVDVEAAPRRLPQNLQGVLRYSIQAGDQSHASSTRPGSGPLPMDDERRRFLEATLRSMTDNPVERLAACVEMLKHQGQEDASTSEQTEQALDQIIDLVDNIDNANDFHKIGGFAVLAPNLCSSDALVRSKTATLIAELSQNNPYIQSRISETDLLGVLLNLMGDLDPNVQVNALYAVSCIIRGDELGLKRFAELNGWTVLLKAMTSSVEKLQLKSAFLLASLCSLYPDIVADLCSLRFVEQLCGLLSVSQCPLLEHLLRALVAMVTNNKRAAAICLEAQLQLDTSLDGIIKSVDEDSDEYLYAQQLKVAVFGASVEDDGER